MMLATTDDGAQIHYEVYDYTDPWIDAETVLLHHGNRSNRKMWRSWIPLLATDFRLVIFDARGRGGSSVPPPDFDFSLDQFATDALAVADTLDEDRFHWLGTSFGSVVGQYVGARFGARLKSLSLLSPPYRFDHLAHVKAQWVEEYKELGALEFTRRDMKKLFPADTDPRILEWHAQEMSALPDHVFFGLQRFTATINLADLLPDIFVPTLIIGATKSDRAPASEAEFMKDQIPDCELVVFDNAHNIAASRTQECVEIVKRFIESHKGE